MGKNSVASIIFVFSESDYDAELNFQLGYLDTVHSNWIYDGIRSTGLSGIRSTVEPSGLISMVHSGSISMLEMTGRSQSTLYYRVDIVLLCVKSR